MLDYLINRLSFVINDVTYNFIITPWQYMINWIEAYLANNTSSSTYYSTALRDAYEFLGKLGFAYACLVVVLIIISCWFVYKVASGFTGWFRFR